MKTLIVYYSRTGTTKKVAQRLGRELGAECEEIIDHKKRAGFFGFLGAGFDALRKTTTKIGQLDQDPADYDLVVVGTPIWAGQMTPAVRTFLSANRSKMKQVAFLATDGGADHAAVWADMGTVVGKNPVAVVSIPSREVAAGEYMDRIKKFVAKINE